MKKLSINIFIAVIVGFSCESNKKESGTTPEENKRLASIAHQRNIDDLDKIFTDDFVGSSLIEETKPFLWNKEGHRNAISSYPNVNDSIIAQVAEADLVAEHLLRTIFHEGKMYKREIMQFTQFKDGKIIKSWQIFGPVSENYMIELTNID